MNLASLDEMRSFKCMALPRPLSIPIGSHFQGCCSASRTHARTHAVQSQALPASASHRPSNLKRAPTAARSVIIHRENVYGADHKGATFITVCQPSAGVCLLVRSCDWTVQHWNGCCQNYPYFFLLCVSVGRQDFSDGFSLHRPYLSEAPGMKLKIDYGRTI